MEKFIFCAVKISSENNLIYKRYQKLLEKIKTLHQGYSKVVIART